MWRGWHYEEGIFLAAGAPIRRGARVDKVDFLDVAPTVLHLLGYPVPRDLKGRVLEEILEPEFLARFPVRSIASFLETSFNSTAGWAAAAAVQISDGRRGPGNVCNRMLRKSR